MRLAVEVAPAGGNELEVAAPVLSLWVLEGTVWGGGGAVYGEEAVAVLPG